MGMELCCRKSEENADITEDGYSSEQFLQEVINSSRLRSWDFQSLIKIFCKYEMEDFNEIRQISQKKYIESISQHLFEKDPNKNTYALIHCYIFESLAIYNGKATTQVNLNKFFSALLFLSNSPEDEKANMFLKLNSFFLCKEGQILYSELWELFYEYLYVILIKLTSSFIFSLYNERYKYKRLLSSLNNISKSFSENRVKDFITYYIFDNYEGEYIEKKKIEEIVYDKKRIFDYTYLRGKFVKFA